MTYSYIPWVDFKIKSFPAQVLAILKCHDFPVFPGPVPHRDGLVVSVPASHSVGHGFPSRPGHIKDHHENGTKCPPPPCLACRSLTVQPNYLNGWLACGTVYGDMHCKDPLGSIVRVGYCFPVPDFYLVLQSCRWGKKHSNGWIIIIHDPYIPWYMIVSLISCIYDQYDPCQENEERVYKPIHSTGRRQHILVLKQDGGHALLTVLVTKDWRNS